MLTPLWDFKLFSPLPSTAASSKLSVSTADRVTGKRRMVSTLNSCSCKRHRRLQQLYKPPKRSQSCTRGQRSQAVNQFFMPLLIELIWVASCTICNYGLPMYGLHARSCLCLTMFNCLSSPCAAQEVSASWRYLCKPAWQASPLEMSWKHRPVAAVSLVLKMYVRRNSGTSYLRICIDLHRFASSKRHSTRQSKASASSADRHDQND